VKATRTDLVVLLAVLATFAVANVWLARRGAREVTGLELFPNASTFNGGPSGLRGLYFFWRELGFEVRIWRRKESNLPDRAAMFVVATPFLPGYSLTAADTRHLLRWVRAGHTLLILGGEENLARVAADALRLGEEERGRVLPAVPSGLMTGIKGLSLSQDRWAHPKVPFVAHAGDQRGPALISRPVGKGQIIALADAGALSNGHIEEADNVILAANLISLAGGPVYFDEYHHGYRHRTTLVSLLFRPPALWVTLQVLFALVLFVHAASRRFGRPVPLGVAPRYRASTEYVVALASMYQRGQARGAVLQRLAQSFRREVARALGLPADASPERLAQAAAQRSGAEAAEVRNLLRVCEEQVASGSRPKEGLLLWAGCELERLRRQVLGIER